MRQEADGSTHDTHERGGSRVQGGAHRVAALFIPLRGHVMATPSETPRPHGEGWTIERAEALLQTLSGVVSVRVVGQPGGDVQEIHLLTTEEVGAKQTVRNVESALMAHFDLPVDHRKISVAQSSEGSETANGGDRKHLRALGPARSLERRILFMEHQTESPSSHQVRMKVTVEWMGERFIGDADGADLPRSRMDAVATATLRGVESAVASTTESKQAPFHLVVDGIRVVDAFDRKYVLVAVMALAGREVAHLSGSASVEDSVDKAVILATLQATDRWVRGRVKT